MLRSFDSRPEHVAALDRVRAWTRERFTLPADAAILVSEVSCALPGCPPRETVVAFWTKDEQRPGQRSATSAERTRPPTPRLPRHEG